MLSTGFFIKKSIFFCDGKCSLLGWMTGNGKSVHLLRVFFDPKSIQKVRKNRKMYLLNYLHILCRTRFFVGQLCQRNQVSVIYKRI